MDYMKKIHKSFFMFLEYIFIMKKIILSFIIFFLFIINVNASYVVIDRNTNNVLIESGKDEKRLIASITKIMTAYIVIKNTNLNDEVVVSDEVLKAYGSSIYLKVGEKITVLDLLYGLMLRSGNDAAIILANYTSGSIDEFVKLMNKEAKKIGMKNTIFHNPSGLDEENENISTAYDMAILTSKAMKNKTFRKIFRTKKHVVKTNLNTHSWINKNKALFMYKYVNGGKTGYTKKAKRTLVTSASFDSSNIIIVTLRENDDFNFHVKTYKYIFSKYKRYVLVNKNNLNIKDTYYKEKYNSIFYVKNNYLLLIRKSDLKKYHIVYELYKHKKVHSNDIVGALKLYKNKTVIYEEPIYILLK